MSHPFDALAEETLRARPSVKWRHFPEDVLACWVADMDFPPAEEILRAVTDFVAAGDLGYPPMTGLAGLREAVCDRLAERHGLSLEPDDLQALPGIIPGLNLACSVLAGPEEGVIVQPPVYPPFMSAVHGNGRELVYNPMREGEEGWEFDLEGLERAVKPSTRLLMLCNPQNPTGRVFRRDELEALAEVVLRHRLWVVSDELHADLVLGDAAANGRSVGRELRHVPFAALGAEVAQRTLTLYGPTKAFNIAGLKIGFAMSRNRELMERLRLAASGLVASGNVLAQAATLAAYRQGDSWLDGTLDYLRGNRAALLEFTARELPGVRLHAPQGTYLAWLDFRGSALGGPAADFLLERARVGLNSGVDFGPDLEPGLEGFARLNFATSRRLLMRALGRIRDTLTP
ncbi:MAG: PatB family C-S lyase [Trueperaceae bacterium]